MSTLQTSLWVTNLLSYHNAWLLLDSETEVLGANKAEPLIERLPNVMAEQFSSRAGPSGAAIAT
jgi:hypothetical protein